MRAILHRNFTKRYKRLTETERHRFRERRDIFLKNPFHPLLNNHALSGTYQGCRSINITDNLRATYEQIDRDIAHFITLGIHPELYE
ncbi:MAG: Uncharacterized protein G01um101466_583 [Parcubacteria group bacterium Gr01-1014_66]|nr:MAG: Uncharacterized protein G01um101466_583 [Parcubacteria group bacterium Gr01-1014_66]